MNILVSGAAGFLGQGLVEELGKPPHRLRLLDIHTPEEGPHDAIAGSVADLETCRQAVDGMDAIVVGHMAPRGKNNVNYDTPTMPFDINVKGTANLFHAAREVGIEAAVVISSTAAIMYYQKLPDPPALTHDLAPRAFGSGFYGISKVMQEITAEYYARQHGMRVAVLRVGYILDGENNRDKYGRVIDERAPLDADRRDIGAVARLALEDTSIAYEVFHVMSTEEAMDTWDLRYTCDRLGWRPAYDFSWLPGNQES